MKNTKAQFSSSIKNGLVGTRIVGGQTKHTYIGRHLIALASLQNPANNSAALLIEFETMQGKLDHCIISRSDLVGRKTKAVFETLLSRSYYYVREHREELLNYLTSLGADLPEIVSHFPECLEMNLPQYNHLVSPDRMIQYPAEITIDRSIHS